MMIELTEIVDLVIKPTKNIFELQICRWNQETGNQEIVPPLIHDLSIFAGEINSACGDVMGNYIYIYNII